MAKRSLIRTDRHRIDLVCGRHSIFGCFRFLLPVLAAGFLVAVACEKHRDGPVRPGESLFDLLTSATVRSYPQTTLPGKLRDHLSMSSHFRLRSSVLDTSEWMNAGPLPQRYRKALGSQSAVGYWTARPSIAPSDRSDSGVIYRFGKRVRPWRVDHDPFPGAHIWWDSASAALRALSPRPPHGISMEFLVPRHAELGAYEIQWNSAHEGQQRTWPRPGDLVRSVEMQRVSRRALFLPAPGEVTIPVGILSCDRLEVSVGLIDHCYEVVGDHVAQRQGCSNGMTFSIKISAGWRTSTVWRRHVTQDEMGRWLPEESVDLKAFLGKKATIHLVTEPTPDGNCDFDYGVFAELRLAGRPKREVGRPHIIMIDIDTLRRDRLGVFGYERATTPRLDRWATSCAVAFDNCVATASWTLPSTASMFTGLAVHQHGIDRFSKALSVEDRPLPLLLREAGYETYGVAEGGYVSADFGFAIGFDQYDCGRLKNPGWSDVLSWLRSRRSEQPFFLFLHTYIVHAPYPFDDHFLDHLDPYTGPLQGHMVDYPNIIAPYMSGELDLSSEDRRYISDLYDAQVYRMDSAVGDFLDSLGMILKDSPYAVIFTSDHGEEFFEHGQMGHGQSLYSELLRVPLIIRFPAHDSGLQVGRSSAPVSLVDIVPTILDIAGLPVPERLPGRSLLHAIPEGRVRVASHYERVHGIQSGKYKLILGPIPSLQGLSPPRQLFCLSEDPDERVNLADTKPDIAKILIEKLHRYQRQHVAREYPKPTRRSPNTRRDLARLRALGYVQDQGPSQVQ